MSDQVPPHSLDAEKSVLGSLFIKAAALHEVSDLEPDDFFLPAHRDVFEAVRGIAARGGAHGDPIAVADELRVRGLLGKLEGGLSYLLDAMNATPTAENIRHYADIVRGTATQRRVIATCAELASTARGGDWSGVGELLSEARSSFAAIEMRGVSATRWIGDDYERVLSEMERRQMASRDPSGVVVTTGLTKLDAMLGPLRADNLIAVGANPGRGKSALALNIAVHNAKHGVPALVFSLEMSRDQLIERAIAHQERINGRLVSAGKLDNKQWHAVNTSRLRNIPLWINDERMTIGRLQAEVRTWRAKRRRERLAKKMSAEDADLAVVVVDYLQLIDVQTGNQQKRYEAVGNASRELKLLSKKRDANLPIIELVQLNRANVKEGTKDGKPREPQISDIRESGNIEQDADVILFPWWVNDPSPVGRHPAEILVRKQRSNVPGRVRVDWEPAFLTFSDQVEQDDPRLPPEPDEPERDTR